MAGEDWPSFAQCEQDTGKVTSLADRLRRQRRTAPAEPDDGLSPLNRTLKRLYPELWDDPAWAACPWNKHHDPNGTP